MDALTIQQQTTGADWLAGLVGSGTARRLRPRTLVVAVYIAHALPNGGGELSNAALSRNSGLSRRTVQMSVHDLERVQALKRRGAVGGGARYALVKPCAPPCVAG